jgi:GNAT superfamily N-acetyltransferase
MLWTIVVVLLILWLLGFVAFPVGNLIHLLLVLVVIVVLFQLLSGRRVWVGALDAPGGLGPSAVDGCPRAFAPANDLWRGLSPNADCEPSLRESHPVVRDTGRPIVDAIQLAESDEDVLRCFPVMRQLRTHLVEAEFVAIVRRQKAGGYRLAFLEKKGDVVSVAGFRFIDNLAAGRILYVDDLATDDASRSRGNGGRLFAWLVERAGEECCSYLELDSGVQRFAAHRFYLSRRMIISSHHFRLQV